MKFSVFKSGKPGKKTADISSKQDYKPYRSCRTQHKQNSVRKAVITCPSETVFTKRKRIHKPDIIAVKIIQKNMCQKGNHKKRHYIRIN